MFALRPAPSARLKTLLHRGQPLPVLQVLPQLKEGGVEESAIALSRFLSKPHKGQKYAMHVAAAAGPRLPELGKTGAKFHPLPLHSKNPLMWLWNAYRLARLIEAENILLVHARSRASAWPARLAAWWCGVPYVPTFHGIYGTGGGFLKLLYNSVMAAGPVVIANSHYTAEHIRNIYKVKPERIVVAPRGTDMGRFNRTCVRPEMIDQLKTALGVKGKTPLLLMVGRLTPWKGQHLLLEALSLLPHRNFVVAFAGGPEKRGTYAADLQGFTKRLGLEANVRWLGSRRDIPQLLAASTLAFSCSTRPEAFGRVAVEAQAMGVPVIASAHGGSIETIQPGHTGWLLPVNKNGEIAPQALSDCIGRALRNRPKLSSMGQAAAAHVRKLYTESAMCQHELAAYRRVLGLPA
jgi:glycosyltransferase involved in cell wall biosynthesis